ncbi:hypothetical protein BH20ACI4_BH20ACI4_02380 [soil metagenome]
MKTYRRIEITAFRRRVTIVSGKAAADDKQTNESVWLNDAETQESIETESEEGQQILSEAVRLLEEKLVKQARKDF